MNTDSIKEFFSKLSLHDLPQGVAVVIALALLFLVVKAGKLFAKLLLLLLAASLLAGTYWWRYHK